MPRRLLSWLLVWLALGAPALAQRNGSLLGLNVGAPPIASGATYVGPIDIVASPTAFYALRAGSAAIAAAGTQTLVNVRRASDNVACDFLVASSGGFGVTTATCNSSTQGGVSFGTFVGSDGTASCTLAGTTGACTGASGTVHVNDTVTGTGLTQPCIVASASNTAPTIEIAGTTTSCGTVSVAETFTFQVAGFVTEAYDQTGNGNHVTQATAGSQPQLLPNSGVNGLPALRGAAGQNLGGTISSASQPYTALVVAERTSAFTTLGLVIGFTSTNAGFYTSTNTVNIYGGSNNETATASDSAAHVLQYIFNGNSSSGINVDGSLTTVTNAGTSATGGGIRILASQGGGSQLTGYWFEGGLWPVAFNSTQQSSQHSNGSAWYGTP